MDTAEETRLWHPFADMGSVRRGELVIERGEDVWVWDSEGRRYLDATASLWSANVGHGRPEIAAAVAEQMPRLEAYFAFGDFSNPPARELAGTLADLAPMPARVFLGSGGGDGVDTAAKLARRYWHEVGPPSGRCWSAALPVITALTASAPSWPASRRTAVASALRSRPCRCRTIRSRRSKRRSRAPEPSGLRPCSSSRSSEPGDRQLPDGIVASRGTGERE